MPSPQEEVGGGDVPEGQSAGQETGSSSQTPFPQVFVGGGEGVDEGGGCCVSWPAQLGVQEEQSPDVGMQELGQVATKPSGHVLISSVQPTPSHRFGEGEGSWAKAKEVSKKRTEKNVATPSAFMSSIIVFPPYKSQFLLIFMNPSQILAYYSRPEIQRAILESAKDREVAGMFRSEQFGQRPNALIYPQDILSQVRQGVVEFHCSLERWSSPSTLQERTGFDVIFDLDCSLFEHGRIAATILVKVLEEQGIKTPAVKFSGNRGFHIGIPWSSLPASVDLKPTAAQFPDLPRKIALFLKELMRPRLEETLLKNYSPETLAEQTGKPLGKILSESGIDPFQIVNIDPVLISPRHLYRMPYSLNKKTFFVSLPIKKEDISIFEREHADPQKIKAILPFLQETGEKEAELLVAEALDWHAKKHREEKKLRPREEFTGKIPETLFPPCIKNIQKGVSDGKKRSVFILINFLRSVKWSWDDIEGFLKEWNKKNSPPLPEQYLITQLRYYRDKKTFPPPNCTQEGYYVGFGVCSPDNICVARENIKNPINYPFRLMKKEPSQKRTRQRRHSRKEQEWI